MTGRRSGTHAQAPERKLQEEKSDEDDETTECSSDSSGWDTDSDDESIPDPDELMDMPSKGDIDWKRISKVIKGGYCWKCVCSKQSDIYSPYFCCGTCGRHFHRECVFMIDGYPDPEFDKSVDEACMSTYKKVRLVKCSICIVSEETQVETMMKYSKKRLNEGLSAIARLMIYEFSETLGHQQFSTGNDAHITMTKILEKAKKEEYLTVEGFFTDYQMIKYRIVRKFARESEATDVVNIALERLKVIMNIALVCLDCIIKSVNEEGKLYNSKEYGRTHIREPCSVPHLVIWIKEGGYPFWPAKVLSIDSNEKTMMVQYFGEKAEVKVLPFPDNEKKICCKAYSVKFPEKKTERKGEKSTKKWKTSMTECRAYLASLRQKYGDDGVVIPVEVGVFNGNLDACVMRMFPKYVPAQYDEMAEAPMDDFEIGSVQVESYDDLLEQADDDLVPELQGAEGGK